MLKKYSGLVLLTFALAAFSFWLFPKSSWIEFLNLKIYDRLLRLEYRLSGPPPTGDILLVLIDNDTLKNIPERWPYSRRTIAEVIERLKGAGAKTIGFDFIFYGRSTPGEDDRLKKALEAGPHPIVLGATLDDEGNQEASNLPEIRNGVLSGLVTKIQDSDGVIRKNITYLVSGQNARRGALSWEMQILRSVGGVDVSSLSSKGDHVFFKTLKGEERDVPVDPDTQSFLIHYRAHSEDFKRLSFYRVWKGDFDPGRVKGKIVLVGLMSLKFQDVHRTPIGWLPGITLNANALLTLTSRDFLRKVPAALEGLFNMGLVTAAAFFSIFLTRGKSKALVIFLISAFVALSYLLLKGAYVWNYAYFPVVAPLLSYLIRRSAQFVPMVKK